MRERDVNVRVTMAQSIGIVVADTDSLWRSWWLSDTTPLVRRIIIMTAWQARAVGALDGVWAPMTSNHLLRLAPAVYDRNGSRFFLTLAPQPHLDGHYTMFGRVVSGTTAMDALVQGDAMRDIVPLAR